MDTTTLLVIVVVVTAARRRWILLQTQGLSRKGGWLAGIIRRLTAGAPLPWAVADLGAIGDRTRREVYDRHIVPRPFAGHTVFCQAKIATSRPRTPLAATQIDVGAPAPLFCAMHPQERSGLMDDTSKTLRRGVTFAGCVLVVVVLYRRSLLVPIALAILLTFVLTPGVTWLERWIGAPLPFSRWWTLVFTVLGLAGWALARQMDHLAEDLPRSFNVELQTRG